MISERSYVSAIRLEGIDRGSSVVGYPHAASEVFISAADGISGFHLAQDERGFRGLAVLSSSGVASEWAGDHGGPPVRRLAFGPAAVRSSVRHIKCSFDVSFYLNDSRHMCFCRCLLLILRSSVRLSRLSP